MPPLLSRWLLPLENPFGFGLQDFLEFALALLLILFSLLTAPMTKGRRWLPGLLPLIGAFCAAHFLFPLALNLLRPAPRLTLPRHQPNTQAPAPKQTAPKQAAPKQTAPKQTSPFEDVK